jgi:sporulation protein YhbH
VSDPGPEADDKHDSPPLNGWYDLFSRGARDWLRHNEKIREAVRERLPEIIAGGNVVSGGARTVRVPVRMLEHYHFRLRRAEQREGVGQGAAKPGDVLAKPAPGEGSGKGPGGRDEGSVELTLEFKVDDIVDWLWEEMELPNLDARVGKAEDTDWKREGWDRRGARSRLDRRRSLHESIKRRTMQEGAPAFTDDDLRFRQLARREQPAIQAVVFLLMDVSGSMSESDRQLAKTFFFWAVQGLRRQYRELDTVFVAHTTEAWEFNEEEFFQVSGSGGTVASTGLVKIREIVAERFNPARYNIYLFYASDGDNYTADRPHAAAALGSLAEVANYCGYLEVSSTAQRQLATETGGLFKSLAEGGKPAGSFAVSRAEDIWEAVRHFFQQQARETV